MRKRYLNKSDFINLMGSSQVPKRGDKARRKGRKPRIKKPITFRVWDGEGKNFPDGSHRLILLANSDGEYIYNENGLSTEECLLFIIKKRETKKNVWFSFGYDIVKILNDIPLRGDYGKEKFGVGYGTLEFLWKYHEVIWKGIKITWIPNKIFKVYYRGFAFHSTDTFGFYQESFLAACKRWGIDASSIEQGKADRSIFDTYTKEEILEYNREELQYALALINALHTALVEADLRPNDWHGPGALAPLFFRRNQIKNIPVPEEMLINVMQAYFGGRSDVTTIGEIRCHHYDISSAYPFALTKCIALDTASWHFNPYAYVRDEHALYHVKWDVGKVTLGPFPFRKTNGTVLFPTRGEGWYWGIEVLAAEKLFPEGTIVRKGAWYPFVKKSFPFKQPIYDAFTERERVGKKSGAGIAIKLLLNSLYGKLAQSVGKPVWNNHIWAGWITAHTRAQVLDAINEVGINNVIAISTDSIFSRVEMKATEGLGGWEYNGETDMLIVGSGLYTIYDSDGKPKTVKRRGMPTNLNHGWILRSWGCITDKNSEGEDSDTSYYTSFVGFGKALFLNQPLGKFITATRKLKDVKMGGTTKRFPSISYFDGEPWLEMSLQPREIPKNYPTISAPYKVDRERKEKEDIEHEISEA